MAENTNRPDAPTEPLTERERQYAALVAYLDERLKLLLATIYEMRRASLGNYVAAAGAVTEAAELAQAQTEYIKHRGEVQ